MKNNSRGKFNKQHLLNECLALIVDYNLFAELEGFFMQLKTYLSFKVKFHKISTVDRSFQAATYLRNIDFATIHEVENASEILLVDSLEVQQRVLVRVASQDPAKQWRTCRLQKIQIIKM
jgi:hypothetical protein